MTALIREQAETELAATIRYLGKARNAFAPSDVAELFPHRSRVWIHNRLKQIADGTRPLPGITLTRHPHRPVYSTVPDGGWPTSQ